MSNPIEPIAEWTLDCNGKQDYDANLVTLSSRYWPRGGGFFTFDTSTGILGEDRDRPENKPCASSTIYVLDEQYAHADFEGETEEEVKAQVEAWAAAQVESVKAAMRGIRQ